VVGAGALGAASAIALVERGARVTVLERFGLLHDRGSSHGRARIFRFGYAEDDYVELAARALEGWRRLGREVLVQTGAVDHGDAAEVGGIAEAFARHDVDHEWLSADAAARRWPGLRFEGDVLFHPGGGRVDAEGAVAAMLAAAQAGGAIVRTDTAVVSVDGDVVTTTAGELRADVIVLATGAWTPRLVDVPISVTVQQPLHFSARDDMAWPSFIHYDEVAVYGLDEPGAGVKLGEHAPGRPIDPDLDSRRADPAALARLAAYAEKWLPGVDPASGRPQLCLYDSTPTADPIIDRLGSVIVAAGFSGHGFKFAPAVGELVADLAEGGTAPERFALLTARAAARSSTA
jgi:sarcosine oxidase